MTRRGFLQGLLTLGTLSLLNPQKILASKMRAEKMISFYNTHTGEFLKKCVFWADGQPLQEGLAQINHLFRDHRTHEIHMIDPKLIDLLHQISGHLETTEPIHLISGYRSPRTNRSLRQSSGGVAKNSQHLYGKAADIYIPGKSLHHIQKAAISLNQGGVGRYAKFVHLDTARPRSW